MKNQKIEKLTEEQKIQALADSLGGTKEEVKKEEKPKEVKKEEKKVEVKKEEKPKEEVKVLTKTEEEEKRKASPIAKVKMMKKKAKRSKRDDVYDELKIFLEEKYGEVRMSKEGWAIRVEEDGELKWHCIRVIAKKVQPEWK